MIVLFGDSHTSSFVINDNKNYMIPDEKLTKNEYFNSFRTWPYTCYNIQSKKDIIFKFLDELKLSSNDIVFFSYGETDIRCHIGFKSNNETEENNLIKNIVENYINFLNDVNKNFEFKIGCYGPIGSGIHNGPNGNFQIPSYSNCIERNKITVKFNNYLKELCEKNNIVYKDIFKHLITDTMNTKSEFYCDTIHLGTQSRQLLLNEFNDIIERYHNL